MYRLSLCLIGFMLVSAVSAADVIVADPMVVTATRVETAVVDVLPSVIVIDRDQIERSVATDVAELLRFHGGLEIGRNGGPGQTTSLFIRGTDSNHALVLIDGVEVNPGTIGGAALQNIAPEMIERIEIVKGPRSTLYGSDAIGGVVNIITRRADGISARLMAGKYNTVDYGLTAGQQWDGGRLSLSLGHHETDGFASRLGNDLPDNGYDNTSVGLNTSLQFGDASLAVRHWHSTGTAEYLDFFFKPKSQDYLNRSTALSWQVPVDDDWGISLAVSQIEDDIDQHDDADYVRTVRNVLEWENQLKLQQHKLVAGVYLAREDTQSLSFGTRFDEDTAVNAVFVEDVIDLGRHQVVLALRHTDHDTFGGKTTYNAEYGRTLGDAWRLVASVGSAFRAPDATDRFGFGGNPDLDAEESVSYELGVRRNGDAHQIGLQVFETGIDDLIEFVFDPVTFAGGNFNVAEARIRGAELSHRWQGGYWDLTTTALYQDPEDRRSGKQLARRAQRQLTVNLVRQFGEHTLGLDVLAASARPDSPFSDVRNAGYVLANLSSQFAVGEKWLLEGRIENLLDTEYELAAGFRSPERGVYVAARYNMR
ncbi:MAG: TonB-dependent receptor [Gammaproteobacteria bacterium]|nr:TonB-dependent receptor [Gammaproteobacteria bacterium]